MDSSWVTIRWVGGGGNHADIYGCMCECVRARPQLTFFLSTAAMGLRATDEEAAAPLPRLVAAAVLALVLLLAVARLAGGGLLRP